MVSAVRQDVRIVANYILMQVSPLQKSLLPVINNGHGTNRTNVDAIDAALENDAN